MATYGGGGAAAAGGAAEQVANHAPSKRSKGVFWSKIAKKDGGPGANATTPRVNSCILSVLCRHPMSRELSLCSAVLTCRSFIVSISFALPFAFSVPPVSGQGRHHWYSKGRCCCAGRILRGGDPPPSLRPERVPTLYVTSSEKSCKYMFDSI